MPAEITQGYVIKTQDYRDTSLLITVFTRDYGKLRAIVKGGRDGRNKLGSSLEPFSLNEMTIYRRKRSDLHLITKADLIENYNAIRKDLEVLATATYFMELIDQMIDAHPHPEIFNMLPQVFDFMKEGNSPKRAARIFEIKLLAHLGFMPELTHCIRCQKANFDPIYFSISSGGIVCSNCRHEEAPLLLISQGAILFLKAAATKSFQELQMVKVSQEVGEKVERMMRQFLDFHLSYKPKSLTFLEKIGA